jgi:DNA-directed RNA polymerase subunit K/omega
VIEISGRFCYPTVPSDKEQKRRKPIPLKELGNVDSKYRFVIVASKRAKELLKGAKTRLKTRSRNPIRIAQNEVKLGLVEFEILKTKKEELPEPEERVFLGEEVVGEIEEEGAVAAGPEDLVHEGAAAPDEEAGPEFSEEFEPLEELEEEKGEEEG